MSSAGGWSLLVVDLQNDFCAGGALAVPDAGRVIAPVNALLAAGDRAGAAIFASRDWHPAGSSHFRAGGGVWPVHCVAGTPGAAFHPEVRFPAATRVVSKGQAPDSDGYSAFDGALPTGEPLAAALAAHGGRRLIVCGLATDYCVRASVLDARAQGLAVSVVREAVAAVNLRPGDEAAAVREMEAAGAVMVRLDAVLADAAPSRRAGRRAAKPSA